MAYGTWWTTAKVPEREVTDFSDTQYFVELETIGTEKDARS
ncbi:hypothetical protein T08_11193 [Trichinella sp. T8]|nr:hypothetical protein T08_11193 [Trichinella sp. T8]